MLKTKWSAQRTLRNFVYSNFGALPSRRSRARSLFRIIRPITVIGMIFIATIVMILMPVVFLKRT
jgi:hypothetical protein